MYQSELEKPFQDQMAIEQRYENAEAAAMEDLWLDLRDPKRADRIIRRWLDDERELLVKLVTEIASAQNSAFYARLESFRKVANLIAEALKDEVEDRANKLMEGE